MLMPFKSGKKAGDTGAAYVEAIRVDTRGCGPQGKLIAVIKNTHASSTMYYKIDAYVNDDPDCVAIAIKAETSINAATAVTQTDVAANYAAVVISVKQNSAAGTYRIDYTTT